MKSANLAISRSAFIRHNRALLITIFAVLAAGSAHAALTFSSVYYGYTNSNTTATDHTTLSTANSTYSSVYGNNLTNLILNGGFEFNNGASVGKNAAAGNPWGTGTNSMSYFTSGRPGADTGLIPDWAASGSTNSATNDLNGGGYGLWGHEGSRIANSATITQGSNAVYFGNWIATASNNGSTTGSPSFAADGRVTWNGTFSIKPGYEGAAGSGVSKAVQLSQTVNNLNTGHHYIFSFWAGGEDAAGPNGGNTSRSPESGDGVFGLTVSGEAAQYTNASDGIKVTQLLAAPYNISDTTFNINKTAGFGGFHYYQYVLTPTSSSVTFTFTNWGHIALGSGYGSELVLDDVALFDAGVPEPRTYGLAGLGVVLLVAMKRRHKTVRG